jgi:hypothetical protein
MANNLLLAGPYSGGDLFELRREAFMASIAALDGDQAQQRRQPLLRGEGIFR